MEKAPFSMYRIPSAQATSACPSRLRAVFSPWATCAPNTWGLGRTCPVTSMPSIPGVGGRIWQMTVPFRMGWSCTSWPNSTSLPLCTSRRMLLRRGKSSVTPPSSPAWGGVPRATGKTWR